MFARKNKENYEVKTKKQIAEIPLEEIVECYSDVSYLAGCRMKFRLTNGEEGMITFPSSGANLLLGGVDAHVQSQKAHTDKWINAINIAKKDKVKPETETPLKLLQLRLGKGERSKQEYEELKKLLEE